MRFRNKTTWHKNAKEKVDNEEKGKIAKLGELPYTQLSKTEKGVRNDTQLY